MWCFKVMPTIWSTGDNNGQPDIFLKDTQTGAIRLVSTSASDQQG
jgi:hypothetical protein